MDEKLKEILLCEIEDAVTSALEAGMSGEDVHKEVDYAIETYEEEESS